MDWNGEKQQWRSLFLSILTKLIRPHTNTAQLVQTYGNSINLMYRVALGTDRHWTDHIEGLTDEDKEWLKHQLFE
jgi:hypothetical protein